MVKYKFLFVLFGLLLISVCSAQKVTHQNKEYLVKGDKIFLENVDVTNELPDEVKVTIRNKLKEQLQHEEQLKKSEKAKKKAEKKQKIAEKKQEKAEKELQKQEKAEKNFANAKKKYDKEFKKYQKLKSKGKLSSEDELKRLKKLESLQKKMEKKERKL